VPAHVIVPRLFTPAADDGTHKMVFRYGEDLSPNDLATDRAVLMAGHISHSTLDYTRLGVGVTGS
jgi:5'-nucleotidase